MIQPIEIKGIVRNTTKQNSENGTMEEIVNIRRRDGNLEPMTPNQEIWGNLNNEVLEGATHADMCSQFFIHNGNNYKHLLGIGCKGIAMGNHQAHLREITGTPYPIYYIADIVDSDEKGDDGLPVPTLVFKDNLYTEGILHVDEPTATIHQIGNMLTIHSGEKLQYILWSDGLYVDVTINPEYQQDDVTLYPDGEIEIMSQLHTNDEHEFEAYAIGGKVSDKDELSSWDTINSSEDIISSVGASSIIQAENFAKSFGILVGYVVAVPVLELYDGSYAFAGKPQLVPNPLHQNHDTRYKSSPIKGSNVKGVMPADDASSTGGSFYYVLNKDCFPTSTKKGGNQTTGETISGDEEYMTSVANPIAQLGHKYGENDELVCKPYFNSNSSWGIVYGNDLLFKVNVEAKPQYKDVIKNVCIFISQQIYDYDANVGQIENSELFVFHNTSPVSVGREVWYKRRKTDDIIRDIYNIQGFYKIHSESYMSVKRNEWIKIKLENKLNLIEQQEMLNVDASFGRTKVSATNSYQYNGRLHISDIKEELFHGFPLEYSVQKKMYDTTIFHPWNWSKEVSDEKFEDGFRYLIYDISTEQGWSRVGVTTNSSSLNLNPILFYPDSRAKYVHIGYLNRKEGNIFSKETVYAMHSFKALEGSIVCTGLDVLNYPPYHYDAEPPVIDINDIYIGRVTWNGTETKYVNRKLSLQEIEDMFDFDNRVIREKNTYIYRPNVLKVSAVETPLVFPAMNTYPIGNGVIRGVCANTTALSVGQWGDAPLFVFASDGIYGLFVDSNGELVYSSSRPISREVCNNPKSITPIDEEIVFSSERGLMSIAGSEVTEISQPIEGKVLKFATEDSHSERLDSAKKLLGFEEIDKLAWVDMSTMPTDEEAKEYLRNAIIGYNYDNRELWVANPLKDYVYVFAEGAWSKSKKKIVSFISDYPKTYAMLENHHVIDISRGTKQPTDCFFLSRPIVIDGENAKHFEKVWLYGDFNVVNNKERVNEFVDALEDTDERKEKLRRLLKHKASLFVYGSADGARYSMIGCGGVEGFTRNIVSKVHRMSLRYIRILFVGKLEHDSRIESLMLEYKSAYGEKSTIKPR